MREFIESWSAILKIMSVIISDLSSYLSIAQKMLLKWLKKKGVVGSLDNIHSRSLPRIADLPRGGNSAKGSTHMGLLGTKMTIAASPGLFLESEATPGVASGRDLWCISIDFTSMVGIEDASNLLGKLIKKILENMLLNFPAKSLYNWLRSRFLS